MFERQAFDAHARELVAAMFSVYITGGFTYIARDLIVRVFYTIGDGIAPFRTSILTVIFNGAFNWLFACYFALGSQGIALSTVTTNGISFLLLTRALTRKIGGLDYREMLKQVAKISFAAVLSFAATTVTHSHLVSSQLLLSSAGVGWARGAVFLCLSALSGATAFLSAAAVCFRGNSLRDFLDTSSM